MNRHLEFGNDLVLDRRTPQGFQLRGVEQIELPTSLLVQKLEPCGVHLCVERFVRLSERTCDVAAEEMQEAYGEVVKVVVRVGVASGVLREVVKGVSGPKKTFYRFRVDRSKLLRGQVEMTGEETIDAFWSELGKRYPSKV